MTNERRRTCFPSAGRRAALRSPLCRPSSEARRAERRLSPAATKAGIGPTKAGISRSLSLKEPLGSGCPPAGWRSLLPLSSRACPRQTPAARCRGLSPGCLRSASTSCPWKPRQFTSGGQGGPAGVKVREARPRGSPMDHISSSYFATTL